MCPGVLINPSPGSSVTDEDFDRHERRRRRVYTDNETTDHNRHFTSPVETDDQPNDPGRMPFVNGGGVEELNDRARTSRPIRQEVNFIRFTHPGGDS